MRIYFGKNQYILLFHTTARRQRLMIMRLSDILGLTKTLSNGEGFVSWPTVGDIFAKNCFLTAESGTYRNFSKNQPQNEGSFWGLEINNRWHQPN